MLTRIEGSIETNAEAGVRVKKYMLYLLPAYVTLLGLKTDICNLGSERSIIVQLFDAVSGFSVNDIVMFIGIICFYRFSFDYLKNTKIRARDIVCVVLPAFCFACFMVLGQAFAYDDSLRCISSGSLQRIKAAIAVCGYFIVFSVGIAVLYKWFESFRIYDESTYMAKSGTFIDKYMKSLHRHTFATVFLTIFIIYIPYMIISYPAIHMGDTCNQLAQGYNFPEGTSGYLKLIDENVRLNGHHPILHTLYLHMCMVIGDKVFGSYNVGIFLVSITQTICMISVISYAASVMAKAGVRLQLVLLTALYFVFSPRIQNYMFLITKDVFTACALLILGISIWQIQKKECTASAYIAFTISGMCLGLLRNEGRYIVLVCVLFLLIFERKKWKGILVCAIIVMLAASAVFNAVMPAWKITPSSRREALSLPFQQTARYIRDYGDEVTPEEKEAISRVLKYDVLAEKYVPENGDFVKENYNEEASAEDLAGYFKSWWQMLKKHPAVYIEAAMNNYYNYFYPGEELAQAYTYEHSAIFMTYVNDALDEIGMSIHYPEWSRKYQQMYETLREKIFELPVLSLFKCSASYVWALILWFFYLVKNKRIELVLPALPMVLSLAVALLASRNGDYFRYLYGIAFSFPVTVALSQARIQESADCK